jgi:tetratricopeptide (TPR) repeat protein
MASRPEVPTMNDEGVSIQTELKIARSYLEEAEAKLHAKADVIFSLARRIYRDPVPVTNTFEYGDFFGKPITTEREKAPLDIGTKREYRQWLEDAALPIYRDLSAAVERLRKIWRSYREASLIEDGEPKYSVAALLTHGWLLLGDYEFYRCNWPGAAKMYRAAFKQEPTNQELLYRLALTFVNHGDPGRAQNFLERVIELAPGSEVAVEAHKELERMATMGDSKKVFRGSPAVLKTLVVVTIIALLVCLSCVCCGLIGGWAEISEDPQLAAAWTIVLIVLGGLAFLIPAVVTAVYYFVKRR